DLRLLVSGLEIAAADVEVRKADAQPRLLGIEPHGGLELARRDVVIGVLERDLALQEVRKRLVLRREAELGGGRAIERLGGVHAAFGSACGDLRASRQPEEHGGQQKHASHFAGTGYHATCTHESGGVFGRQSRTGPYSLRSCELASLAASVTLLALRLTDLGRRAER